MMPTDGKCAQVTCQNSTQEHCTSSITDEAGLLLVTLK